MPFIEVSNTDMILLLESVRTKMFCANWEMRQAMGQNNKSRYKLRKHDHDVHCHLFEYLESKIEAQQPRVQTACKGNNVSDYE
jgi:hypothetical protein